MQSFKASPKLTQWIIFCALIGIMIVPTIMKSNLIASSPAALISANEAAYLPSWLQQLSLNDQQVRQVFEIDSALEQRLELILTSSQYGQWQSSRINLSDEAQSEAWTFEDLNIELSPYQQTAVEASFRAAMQSLLNILSSEQKQQLIQYLSEENLTSASELGI